MKDSSTSAAPIARRVRDAITLTERLICGDGAVTSAATAEGLALTGYRASRVLDGSPTANEPGSSAMLPAGWVDHRLHAEGTSSGAHAFTLVASSPQEAVDLCLVAHRIAARIGRPGWCAVDGALAESFAVTWLPGPDAIADLPTPTPVPREANLADVPPDVIVRETLAALADFEAASGRLVGPIVGEHLASAERVLVGIGDGGVLARETAAVLREVGIPCGAVAVTLADPFPSTALREALQGIRSVTVFGDARDPFAERVGRRVSAALADGLELQSVVVPNARRFHARGADAVEPDGGGEAPAGRLHALATLELLWKTDLSAAIVHEPRRVVGARIGVHPGGRWTRNVLLDAVSRLGWLSAVQVDCVKHVADDVAVVAVGDGPVRAGGLLDLLLVTDPATFRGEGPLRRLREGGTLLLCAPRPGPVFLTGAQRALVSGRGLRLRQTTERAPTRVEAAVLKATTDLEFHGESSDLMGTLVAAIPESHESERLELLAGAAALADEPPETIDTAPEAMAPTLLRPRPPEDDQGVRQALRGFHFAGSLTEHGREARPATALRPAAFPVPDAEVGVPMLADERTLLERWAERVSTDRRRRRVDFAEYTGGLVDRLNVVLGNSVSIDDDGKDDQAIAASLGEFGRAFVDPEQLREKLTASHPAAEAAPLPTARRGHAARLLDLLLAQRKRIRAAPIAHVLVRDVADLADAGIRDDIAVTGHDDPLRAAIGLFDGLARRAIADARTVRAARLEAEGEFDEELHGPRLERLDWASLRASERLLAPSVVVVESARRLRGPALAALSELIRSGRSVHVLVTESVTDTREELLDERAGFHPGLGYLMMAHREALVIQTTPGCSAHLAAGLERAATSLEPVVIVAAAASSDVPWPPPVQLEAALRSRAFPCFRYDPGSGVSWAERFALEANPQPDDAWPSYLVDCVDEAGAVVDLREAFTFAHAASLDPGWRDHFLVVGPDEWLDDQLPIAEWLELVDSERSRAIPYIWVVDADDRLARALVRWELAFACRDRAQAWRLLQELGGTHDVYAERAAEQARRELQQKHAERTALVEADHARAVAVAEQSAAEAAIERLVWAFVDPEAAAQLPATAVLETLAATETVESPSPAATTAVKTATTPYIDSFLCTTCNDCTNLNPRLFVYNDDKQATIGDPSKGTFSELVKAAEVCPARCIHPGKPREGDKTVTPKLLERAARFD